MNTTHKVGAGLTAGSVRAISALILIAGMLTVMPSGAAAASIQPQPPAAGNPSPLAATDGTNLGKYAFNGAIRASTVDPVTGIAYVGGDFTQVGIRTGSVANVNPPGSGSDQLATNSPDVIGAGLSVFADNATGYFLSGSIASINGDGVQRRSLVRMTAAGSLDPVWHVSDACNFSNFPTWDLGDRLAVAVDMSVDGSGHSTVGLQFIDKAKGQASMVGAGSCGGSSRTWPSIAPFPPLAACAGWDTCSGNALDLAVDSLTHSMIVETQVSSRETATSTAEQRHYLVAYDMSAGARLWWTELEADAPAWWSSQAYWGGQTTKIVGLGGALLAVGYFPLNPGAPTDLNPQSAASTMMLLDEATGGIVQRWNALGEQDPADPSQTIEAATPCTPADSGWSDQIAYPFVPLSSSTAVGYASPVAISGGHRVNVCSYSLSGSGAGTRLAAANLGQFDSVPGAGPTDVLPGVLFGGR